jgi:archaellum component FlaC
MSESEQTALRLMIREETTAIVAATEDRIMLTLGQFALDVGHRFDRVDERLDGLENRMDGLENRMDGLESRVGRLEDRVGGLDRKCDIVMSRLDDHGLRLVRLESK